MVVSAQAPAAEDVYRVGSATTSKELGSAIAKRVTLRKPVRLHAVGAGAVNQACKAIIVAQRHLSSFDIELVEQISFFRGTSSDGQADIVGIAIRVEGRKRQYRPEK